MYVTFFIDMVEEDLIKEVKEDVNIVQLMEVNMAKEENIVTEVKVEQEEISKFSDYKGKVVTKTRITK